MTPIHLSDVHDYCSRIWGITVPALEPLHWIRLNDSALEHVQVGANLYTTNWWIDDFVFARGMVPDDYL